MVFNSGFEQEKSSASEEGAQNKNSCLSKTSVRRQKSVEESANPRRPKSSSAQEIIKTKKRLRVRSKTVDRNDLGERNKQNVTKSDLLRSINGKISEKTDLESSDLRKKSSGGSRSRAVAPSAGREKENGRGNVGPTLAGTDFASSQGKLHKKHSEILPSTHEKVKVNKKPSEIPKLKTVRREGPGTASPRTVAGLSKLPVKKKYLEGGNEGDSKAEAKGKSKPESLRKALNSYRVKREARLDEKIKEAMKDDFEFLVPLYESEFRKITEVWVNALYCSLTVRTNLVKLLHQAFPQISRTQFQTEDETLLRCIALAKNQTKCEADKVLQFIRSLQANREKAKESYTSGMASREIAQVHNHDWKSLVRKISEIGEEANQLQMEVPELQKKKEIHEASQAEKIREMETSIERKEGQMQKMVYQLNLLKDKEASYKKNIFWKIQDYRDIKADVMSLKSMEKEYADTKAKYATQNEVYEKKIRDLEFLLDEKRKILEKERDIKQKLQIFLGHLQTLSVGKEQVDFVMGRPNYSKEKRREQLWVAAVKLVLRGFLIQMKKLEKDRNKMLLELQSNDSENFNAVASSLIKRDNFIKTIKHQMKDFQKACNYPKVKVAEGPCIDTL